MMYDLPTCDAVEDILTMHVETIARLLYPYDLGFIKKMYEEEGEEANEVVVQMEYWSNDDETEKYQRLYLQHSCYRFDDDYSIDSQLFEENVRRYFDYLFKEYNAVW